jgi:2-dehydropantoate 2-reductase
LQQKIAIIGVGAIGSVIAALLQQTGRYELVLCVRSPRGEFTVDTPDGPVVVRAKVVNKPSDAGPVDWVLVATKAYDVPAAAEWLGRLCADGAPVAVLQNGVEHRERFAPYIATESILPVMVDCPVERIDTKRIRQRGVMHLKVPQSALGNGFVGLFAGTNADAMEVPDYLTAIWRKLCLNSAGVLPALLRQPAGVFRRPAIGGLVLEIVRECAAVGRAEGAKLGDEIAETVLKECRAAPADSVNSLLADRLAGRALETDARNGVIVRLGEKHGIPTPYNRMAVALLDEISRNVG